MSEHALWVSFEGLLPRDCHVSRIESDTSAGFPDLHYTYRGVSGTIELKCARAGSRAKQPFRGLNGLRPSQKRWIKYEVAADGIVWVVAQAFGYIYVLNGLYADRFNDFDQRKLESFCSSSWRVGYPVNGLLESILMNKV